MILNKEQMDAQVDKFIQQLSVYTGKKYRPDIAFYDYGEGDTEIRKYNREVLIELPDFDLEFRLVIEETGTSTPGTYEYAPEWTLEDRTVDIQELRVYDIEHGKDLDIDPEKYNQIFELTYDLIQL